MSAIAGAALAAALPEILKFAMEAYLRLPALIQAGQDVRDILNANATLVRTMVAEERAPTNEEWEVMDEMIAALRSELHRPEK